MAAPVALFVAIASLTAIASMSQQQQPWVASLSGDRLHSWVILFCSVDYATITYNFVNKKNALCFITIA
jgi:hypothetical protein